MKGLEPVSEIPVLWVWYQHVHFTFQDHVEFLTQTTYCTEVKNLKVHPGGD
jgi:hypothetical protein